MRGNASFDSHELIKDFIILACLLFKIMGSLNRLILLLFFLILRWPAFWRLRMILPVFVTLNLLDRVLLVFCFGIIYFEGVRNVTKILPSKKGGFVTFDISFKVSIALFTILNPNSFLVISRPLKGIEIFN